VTTATADAAVCADVAALRASVQQLTQVSIGASTASELKSGLSQVSSDLSKLAANAGNQLSPQVDALKSALSSAQTAVSNLTSGDGSITDVTSALGNVTTAASALFDKATSRCPS
jgi:hypothetical protein